MEKTSFVTATPTHFFLTSKVGACNSCLASLSSPASCYFRHVCYVHSSQAQPHNHLSELHCHSTQVLAFKMSPLSCELSNHTGQQGEWGTQLPCQHLSMNSYNNTISHPELFSFWLRSTDQNWHNQVVLVRAMSTSALPWLMALPRLSPLLPQRQLLRSLTCWVLSPTLQKQQHSLPACLGFMNPLKQMQDRTV